jgi:hypothetical protein
VYVLAEKKRAPGRAGGGFTKWLRDNNIRLSRSAIYRRIREFAKQEELPLPFPERTKGSRTKLTLAELTRPNRTDIALKSVPRATDSVRRSSSVTAELPFNDDARAAFRTALSSLQTDEERVQWVAAVTTFLNGELAKTCPPATIAPIHVERPEIERTEEDKHENRRRQVAVDALDKHAGSADKEERRVAVKSDASSVRSGSPFCRAANNDGIHSGKVHFGG